MDRQLAIETLEGICKWYHGISNELVVGEKQMEAFEMAIADMRKMQYLEGRPCTVCKAHSSNGCGVWSCVFKDNGKENA